ncbi:MAG: sulfite exporter TauE/SafE family protein [Rhizomicrobium sp.]
MTLLQTVLSLLSGGTVGLSLGLIGGGGSVLAVPLLVYVVGMKSPHEAIGTSAVAVAANAFLNLLGHARKHTVKWSCAVVFALAGIAGAAIGADFGKAVNGAKLLAMFGALMIVISVLMLRPRRGGDVADVRLDRTSSLRLLPPLVGIGFTVGALSGFFGIGGGFLIVPGLVAATSMPLLNAIGSSLVCVTAFGATTAVSYALSGFVNWPVALAFIAGGTVGGYLGTLLAHRLAADRRVLALVFSGIVAAVGIYVLLKGLPALIA